MNRFFATILIFMNILTGISAQGENIAIDKPLEITYNQPSILLTNLTEDFNETNGTIISVKIDLGSPSLVESLILYPREEFDCRIGIVFGYAEKDTVKWEAEMNSSTIFTDESVFPLYFPGVKENVRYILVTLITNNQSAEIDEVKVIGEQKEITNIALGGIAYGTNRTERDLPIFAIDGNYSTIWDSGFVTYTNGNPIRYPESIKIDLQSPSEIQRITLFLQTDREENTTHHISFGYPTENGQVRWVTEYVVNAETSPDNNSMEWVLESPKYNVRYVWIYTQQNTAIAAWQEIEIYGRNQEYFSNDLEYFGYFLSGNHINAVKDHSNLVFAHVPGDPTGKLEEARQNGLKVILLASEYIDSSTKTWVDQYDIVNVIEEYKDTIAAFAFIDEPYKRGHSYEQMQNYAQTTKADFPEIPCSIIFSYVTVISSDPNTEFNSVGKGIPPEYDWVAINRYLNAAESPDHVFYDQIWLNEDCLGPKMHPHQKYMILGQSSIINPVTDGFFTPQQKADELALDAAGGIGFLNQQNNLMVRAREFRNYIKRNHRIAVFMPFLWHSLVDGGEDIIGAEDLTQVRNEHIRIGKSISDK